MTGERELLENHTLVVRDGRILDDRCRTTTAARALRAASLARAAEPPVDARTGQCPTRASDSPGARSRSRVFSPDAGCTRHRQHAEGGHHVRFATSAIFRARLPRTAVAQGLRAVIGLPVAEHAKRLGAEPRRVPDARAASCATSTRRIPSISTAFAPLRQPTPSSDARWRASARWPPSSMRASVVAAIARSATSMSRVGPSRHAAARAARVPGAADAGADRRRMP